MRRSILSNSIFFLLAGIIVLNVVQSAHAFEDYFEGDFVEGEELTKSLGVLDTLKFTYYGDNYSTRVLGVMTNKCTLRIEKIGFDVDMGETKSFNIDEEPDMDFFVTLLLIDGKTAKFRFELNEKPEVEDEPDEEDDTPVETNTTSNQNSQTASTTTTASNNGTNSLLARYNMTNRPTGTRTVGAASREEEGNESKLLSITGAETIKISLNLTLTPKSALFALITVAIIGGVLITNKALETLIDEDSGKQSKTSVAYIKFKKAVKKRAKQMFKRFRIKLGALIAGNDFEANERNPSNDKKQKKYKEI